MIILLPIYFMELDFISNFYMGCLYRVINTGID